jgi:hypothetical protein
MIIMLKHIEHEWVDVHGIQKWCDVEYQYVLYNNEIQDWKQAGWHSNCLKKPLLELIVSAEDLQEDGITK